MHMYFSILMTWADSTVVWTDFVPGDIHNKVAIKLMVSVLLTGHICNVRLFSHHNRFCTYIYLVPCKSFVILISY